ncbi:thiamine ABC transporter substrate-binding protein [Mesotoga prima]|jgi:thiamine transport system substrate-binding protein|uniref:thiamine ABC transporter substrate-binding protein n=1 Tax=Mesotoga TaxID=1184396 RepID=UPI00259535A3|nr:thiamine ABC transporter substrate-binding protein [Mesotoga prima]HOP38066.1 thiamine ABC transporter substrate-binding protein [Mesotoga prima]HPJ32638.1 thiamine ABC transporter substrate-binding protein [Mesotoga prima]HPQ91733.1 thiamine ABC transporter substrate-binding protein [Mesotoga prima]
MRRALLLSLMIFFLSLSAVSALTVYSYDSLEPLAEESFGKFTEQTGIDVEFRAVGDSGSLLSLIISEREKFDGDVVIGIDNLLSRRAFEEDIFLSYRPMGFERIISNDLLLDEEWRLTPYDFGSIALICNGSQIEESISTLWDLTKPEFERSVIIQDPRTSSTGLSFLAWTYLLFGERFEEFWRALTPSILTVSLSWDDAFQKFESGEAPIMVSYATDGAYSKHYYGESIYSTVIPEGKGYVQVEGAGIIKWTDNLEEAKLFMDFILSEDFQSHIPLNQWMFPVIEVEMPPAFDYAVKPQKILKLSADVDLSKLIETWEEVIYER